MALGSGAWTRIGDEIELRDIFILIGTEGAYDSYGVRLEVNAAINLRKPLITLRRDKARIFGILYGPKYVEFDPNALEDVCRKIVQQFDSIIEQHSRDFLRMQVDAADAILHEPPLYLAFGYSAEPSGDISGLDKPKLERVLTSMHTGYEHDTIIPFLAGVRPFNSSLDSNKKFVEIYRSFFYPVGDFNRPDVYIDFSEVGKAVALGERNFINRHLFEQGSKTKLASAQFTIREIREVVQEMRHDNFRPSAMLAPIGQYTTSIMGWLHEDPQVVLWENSRLVLALDGDTRLRVFWSNKYVPYEDYLVFDSGVGEWIVKPDPRTGTALTASVSRSTLYPKTRLEVRAKTVAYYDLKNPRGIRVLKPEMKT